MIRIGEDKRAAEADAVTGSEGVEASKAIQSATAGEPVQPPPIQGVQISE